MSGVGQAVEFRNGELCIRNDREHYRIRAWPGPQAFTSEDGKEWKRCWPEFRFIEYPARKKKAKVAKRGGQLELGFDLPPVQVPQTKAGDLTPIFRTVGGRHFLS